MRGFRLRYSFYSDPREKKPLDQSALAFVSPSQSQERLKPHLHVLKNQHATPNFWHRASFTRAETTSRR